MTDSYRRGGLVSLTVTMVWLTLATACTPGPAPVSTRPRAQEQGPLRVGVAETAPPVIFEQDDQPAGIEADLARQLGAALGREVQFVSIYWPNLILELRAGRIDIIMAGMSITDARKRRVAFAQPYLVVGQKALIRAADEQKLGTIGAIRVTGRRVGVEKDSTGEQFARSNLPRAKTFALPTLEAAVKALIAGQIDVVIHDSPSIQWSAGKHQDQGLLAVPGRFTTESLAWAVDPDNTELLAAVNAVLDKWQQSGQLKETLSRWLPEAE